ncbi:hypothetical protein [Streptomyces lavenduligriseus]|uniref:Uncharacterized protein n=1 Tax=Streptomyces lavenduligriseus TaxID=67315 RepID=A0ABT0NUW4_9ACTN|nr:hypothetical protein [Streptomyces lavenduligriseus]MCL3994946.1 hypothetical protein [Streptomyces lavenduligriseus]
MSESAEPGSWDGPWYRVHTKQFEAAFLPNAGEDLEAVDDIDVFVALPDGSRWPSQHPVLPDDMQRDGTSQQRPDGTGLPCDGSEQRANSSPRLGR